MLVVLAAAHAQEGADARARLYDALLLEAGRGDTTAAVSRYQELARSLPIEAPTHAEALYWMGHGLYELDRIEDARDALLEGIRTGRCAPCRTLLEQIELEQHSVTQLPTVWTFDGHHGLFHPAEVQDRGAIRVTPRPGGGPALEWSTLATPDAPDRLVAGVRAPAAEQVRFGALSAALDAWLVVEVVDLAGRRFASDPIEVPRGALRRVVVPFRSLSASDQGPRLDPRAVARVEIVDLTGTRGSGPNTLWIDDFEVR